MINDFVIFLKYFLWIAIAIFLGASTSFFTVQVAKVAYNDISSGVNFSETYYVKTNQAKAVEIVSEVPARGDKQGELSMIFVGDIMLARGVAASVAQNGGNDFSFLFQNANFLKTADLTFGNLEGPLSDKGKDIGNLYSFRMDPTALGALQDAGFNVLSVANNHIADWGEEAFLDTLKRLSSGGIMPVGGGVDRKSAERVRIIERGGFKVGFLAFSDLGPEWFEAGEEKAGILLVRDKTFTKIINQAAAEVDYLIISIHFGDEYKPYNKRQERISKSAIDAGARVIIGHHPHIAQKVEIYNGGVIAYSLGNFIFDQAFSVETMESALLKIIFKDNEISKIYRKVVRLNQFFQVFIVDEK